jgi:purine-binding chemotaxis protein CheW
MNTADGAYLVVGLAGVSRSIAVHDIHEVLHLPPVARVPAAPPWVRGLAAIRGRLVPVVELPEARAAAGAATAPMLVIVGVSGRPIGIVVDRIDGVVDPGGGGDGAGVRPPAIDVRGLRGPP